MLPVVLEYSGVWEPSMEEFGLETMEHQEQQQERRQNTRSRKRRTRSRRGTVKRKQHEQVPAQVHLAVGADCGNPLHKDQNLSLACSWLEHASRNVARGETVMPLAAQTELLTDALPKPRCQQDNMSVDVCRRAKERKIEKTLTHIRS